MIHLYVKTHNVTGLKYFGKTTRDDPYSYKGSGKYWKLHLKVHGVNFSTEIIDSFEDLEECKRVALEFSETNNIAKSDKWANLRPENVTGGWEEGMASFLGQKHSEESRKKMSIAAMGNTKWLGKKPSEETIQKRVAKTRGKKRTEESRKRMSVAAKIRWAKREAV